MFIWEKNLKIEDMCGRGNILGKQKVGSRVKWLTLSKRRLFSPRLKDGKMSV